MTVTKTDISSNLPTTSQVITVASGEKVLAETENANNSLLISALILAYNWIIDSGVELSGTNTYTGNQIFNIIKTAYIESLTGSSDVVLQNGTFKYGGTGSTYEVANKAYVLAQIAAAATVVGAAMTGANGSVGGTAGAAPAPAAADNVKFLRGDATWALPTVPDADKGDITVTSSGTVWTIDNLAVTTAKINDLAVTTGKINDLGVTTGKIAAAAVTQSKLAFTFATKTTTYTAVANDYLFCNTSSAAWTLSFPASASAGDMIHIVDLNNTFDTKNLTINPNGLKIEAQTSDLIVNIKGFDGLYYYIDTTTGWKRL